MKKVAFFTGVVLSVFLSFSVDAQELTYPTNEFLPKDTGPFTSAQTYFGCVGEHETNRYTPCDPRISLDCGTFRRAGRRLGEYMAGKVCGSGTRTWTFNFQVLQVRGDNECGYGHYQVTCFYHN